MNKRELIELTKTIRSICPTFKGYDDLINYKYEEVKKNFLLHKGANDPTYEELTRGLRYESEKDVLMQCDICGKKIPYTTWENFEEHHRKCSKIDFINRQSKKIRGESINIEKYYSMTDEELNKNYKKVMDYYLKHKDNTSFIKTL